MMSLLLSAADKLRLYSPRRARCERVPADRTLRRVGAIPIRSRALLLLRLLLPIATLLVACSDDTQAAAVAPPPSSPVEKVVIEGEEFLIMDTLAGYKVRVPRAAVLMTARDKATGKVNWIELWYYWDGEHLVAGQDGKARRANGARFDSADKVSLLVHFYAPNSRPVPQKFFLSPAENGEAKYSERFPEYHLIGHVSKYSISPTLFGVFEIEGIKSPIGTVITTSCYLEKEDFIENNLLAARGALSSRPTCRGGYRFAEDSRVTVDIYKQKLKSAFQIYQQINEFFATVLVKE